MSVALLALTDEDVEPNVLAQNLHQAVRSNAPRLSVDFPRVLELYRSPTHAEKTIRQRRREMREAEGRYGVYVVMIDGVASGMATASQLRLRQPSTYMNIPLLKLARDVVDGPLLALWLVENRQRSEAHQRLLPQILRLAAGVLKQNRVLCGQPYTVVRPEHGYVCDCLTDPNNGFGGFARMSEPQPWPHIGDGVRQPRQLYVAQHTMESIRDI
jgi:hypothetical protein